MKGLMYDCPQFLHCNAPLCPLDEDWRDRKMVAGETVCLYVREIAKGGDLRCVLPAELAEVVGKEGAAISDCNALLRAAVKKAAKTPSKISQFKRNVGHESAT